MNFGEYYKTASGEVYKCIGRAYGRAFDRENIILYCKVVDGTTSDVMYCTEGEFLDNFKEI